MSKSELIDSHVSVQQCKLAVEALLTHENKIEEKKQENELLPGKEQNVWLMVTVKKMQPEKKFKPIKVPIVHPLVDPRTTAVCLITKDPQREYKNLLETHGIKFISRVVGIEKLKGKFRPFEARRMLLKENGMFLADERILPRLPGLLGVKWFEAKKQPIPVCLTRKDLKGELERAISSTYMNQNKGTCTAVKIGTLSHKPSQVLANVVAGLPTVIKNIKDGWDNIQSIHIKTNSSVSLPIWTCNLGELAGGRVEGSDEEMEVDQKVEKKSKAKGRKRVSEEQDGDEETAEKPKKKTKGVEGKTTSEKTQQPSSAVKGGISVFPSTSNQKNSTPQKSSSATTSTPTTDVSASKQKSRKLKGLATPAVAATEPAAAVPEVEAQPVSNTPSKLKKKKSRLSIAATSESTPTSMEVDEPVATGTTDDPTISPSPPRASSPSIPVDKSPKGKGKKGKQAGAGDASVSVSAKELKQKRSGGAGEKKKDKVVKAKGGKSAKNNLLGKKVAQE